MYKFSIIDNDLLNFWRDKIHFLKRQQYKIL